MLAAVTSAAASGGALEPSLRRVALGARLVGIGWMVLLGLLTLARERSVGVVAVLAAAVVWGLAASSAARLRPESILSVPALVVDVLIAGAALVVASEVGASFYGGYPLLVVAVGAVRSRRAAWTVAAVLTAVVASLLGPAEIVGSVSQILTYAGGALVLTWTLGVLREAEERRLAAEATAGRAEAERVRAEERAEISRHLHDSVLQTLALVQRNAASPGDVVTLARRQERELRDWLRGDAPREGSLVEALAAVAADVESAYGVPVEVVTVGDAAVSAGVAGLLGAAREAIVNAARHSGAPSVSVYAEAGDGVVRAYVRDRGSGFDPAAVDGSRTGISSSIVGRMASVGGTATCRTSPAGTEWVIEAPA